MLRKTVMQPEIWCRNCYESKRQAVSLPSEQFFQFTENAQIRSWNSFLKNPVKIQ